jgi:hypothetical protein
VQTENKIRAVVSYDLAAGTWGTGVLTYKGKDYPFSVSGFLVDDFGITGAELSGEVLNLKNLEDFSGNYRGLGAGDAVAGAMRGTTVKNQNGVIINVTATTQGLRFELRVDRMKIELGNR